MSTLFILLIVYLVTVSLIPVTIKVFSPEIEEAQKRNYFNVIVILKLLLSIPVLGTAIIVIMYLLLLADTIKTQW